MSRPLLAQIDIRIDLNGGLSGLPGQRSPGDPWAGHFVLKRPREAFWSRPGHGDLTRHKYVRHQCAGREAAGTLVTYIFVLG